MAYVKYRTINELRSVSKFQNLPQNFKNLPIWNKIPTKNLPLEVKKPTSTRNFEYFWSDDWLYIISRY